MDHNDKDVDKRLVRLEELCREQGIKLTHQRMEILKEIVLATDHPDTEQVFNRVRERLPTVSIDTVYRTLWLLDDLGLITTVGSKRERVRFDANLDEHHHFLCKECGVIHDFSYEEFNNMKLPDEVQSFGSVESTKVNVVGTCSQCSKNR